MSAAGAGGVVAWKTDECYGCGGRSSRTVTGSFPSARTSFSGCGAYAAFVLWPYGLACCATIRREAMNLVVIVSRHVLQWRVASEAHWGMNLCREDGRPGGLR